MEEIEIFRVKFPERGIFVFDPNNLELSIGDYCITEDSDSNIDLGQVVGKLKFDKNQLCCSVQKILRKATEDDKKHFQENMKKEIEAREICRKKIQDRELPMKLVRTRYSPNGKKITFYFTSEKLGLGEFLLAGKPTPKIKKRRNIFWIVVIGLIALFALQPALTTKGIPSQIWVKDTQHSIKLGQYFRDPDLDVLKFYADKTKNIDITFDKDTALLNPSPGWTGEEYTIFHAEDTKDETASSNPVKLIVKDSIGITKGITWLNLIILALLLFLVIIALFEKRSK